MPPVQVGGISPQFVPLRAWLMVSGMSRSQTYRLLSSGELRAKKNGTRLLINLPHGLEYLKRLPDAEIKLADRPPVQPPADAPRKRRGRPPKVRPADAPASP
jgi:hypothetical protein